MWRLLASSGEGEVVLLDVDRAGGEELSPAVSCECVGAGKVLATGVVSGALDYHEHDEHRRKKEVYSPIT